jgi:thiol:disulfide interchange protein
MNRRTFLALGLALPFVAHMAQMAQAEGATPYTAEAVATELAAGKTVVLDFSADWCPSCQAQGRTIAALRDENPGYAGTLAFFVVDWDTYKDSDLTKTYGIVRRGSLVLLNSQGVVAQTDTHSSKGDLKAMFDQAGA